MSKTVGIWVGHGTSTDGSWDPGATYKNWTEADRALLITQSFVNYMRTSGVTVYTDAFDKNNKNMIKQVEVSNKKKVSVHIAIHLDWSGAPSGTLPIYYPGSVEGKKLATALNNAVTKDIGIKSRGLSTRTDLYEVKQTNMPAVIFECGSIKADIKLLDTEKECSAYGKALAKGLCNYLGVKFKESKSTTTTKVKYKTSSYAKKIKTGLKTLGYFNGTIDSYVTPEYTAAVLKFQKKAFKRASDQDGIGGNDTLIAVQTFVNFKDIKYFEPEEFRCNCGHCTGYPAVVNKQLLKNLDALRKEAGSITITSGLRCKWKNSRLSGSSSTSRHMSGKAADFYNAKLTGTKAKRTAMVKRWYKFKGANYSYANTAGMGNAVHCDVK